MRKRKPKVRVIAPDPRYGDEMVTQFVNMMMMQGKKSVAFKVFYDAMDLIKERTESDEHAVMKKAITAATDKPSIQRNRQEGTLI